MAALFVATLTVPEPSTFVLFLRAIAEAGMIGGLADWFAVEALFRHPLGIPIPHTALLPKSKNRVARNVGGFITEHFLKPDLIRTKLREMDVASALKNWLLIDANTSLLATKVAKALQANLDESGPSEAPSFFKTMLRNLLMRPKTEIFIRKMIDDLMSSDLRGELTDHALVAVRSLLQNNDEAIKRVVQERSRWWIASTADRRLADMLIGEMTGLINDLLEHDSALRHEFDEALTGFALNPKQEEKIGRTVQGLLLRLVDSDNFDTIVSTFIRGLKRSLEEDLQSNAGKTVGFLQATIQTIANKMDANPAQLETLNIEISQAAGDLVSGASTTASNFIASTIQSWDEKEMVSLFEAQVGNDLQFIRMNGTVLGGIVGGILFGLTELVLGIG
jgi:uncharacterized membrane-anchored protein YjiN (DUF445 family)